jgi:RNA polymerase sigma-70 factor (ECF subfamily)
VGITPSQPVPLSTAEEPSTPAEALSGTIPEALLEELWQISSAEEYGLDRSALRSILIAAANRHNCGHPAAIGPSPDQQSAYLRSLRLADLALARACALGSAQAWEFFLAHYRQPLTRAAIAITGNETEGVEIADALYAELYGLNLRDGQRRSPLDSYQGRGSLLGWLRTTLAQRHVDHHRKTWREQPLTAPSKDDPSGETSAIDPPAPTPQLTPDPRQLTLLAAAVQHCLSQRTPEDRFLLAAYYLDQRTLAQIARTLSVHEATISRKVRRAVEELRKALLRNLQERGLSKAAAQEALGADPRDLTGVSGESGLDLQLKKLLQFSKSGAFPEKAGL